ncbi:DUF6439 family protein [Prochlorococcus sp. MIT 1223]|uniref:DUF6439 family protein n=1 Tax=Prochlorococcus sp. MIT 1223 TaxID=3096217 RepID=UPI002A755F2B|nr:DUF6439 family protein [Prochlorococcus sp. MIT 1223]
MKSNSNKWSNQTKELLKGLHKDISINNRDWHVQKSDHEKRAAELLVAALSQLINEGEKEDIKELISQSLKWLNHEIKDPGCPNH